MLIAVPVQSLQVGVLHPDVLQIGVLQFGVGERLVAAATKGDVDCVTSLLERGADVNSSKDGEGCTPLVAGCMSGSTELVKLLIERGADVNMRADITTAEVSCFITPLGLALGQGHEEVAVLLIEHRADVNAVGVEGKVGELTFSGTPLMLAAGKGLQHATKLLLERGAEVHKEIEVYHGVEPISGTALMCAANAEVAKLLLDYGAQVDFQGSHGGCTALMGVSEGRYEVAERLLERGAQVDLQNSEGETALIYAVVRNKANIVQLLIQHKASIDIKTKQGVTALDLAREKGLTDIAELLNNPATAKYVVTPAESVIESESVASKSTPPGIHCLVDIFTSMFQVSHAKLDMISSKVDNIDSRLSRVESDVAMVTSAVSSLQLSANVRVQQQVQDQQVQCVVAQSETLTVVTASNNAAPQQEDSAPSVPQHQEDPAPPDLADANSILKPLAHEWENIGMYLRIPEHEIKAIKMQEHGVVRNCLRELLIVWLRGVAPPPSWRGLADAVGEVDEKVAREIRNRHTH